MTIKDTKYLKINSVNPLYLVASKMNGWFEEINENKYLALVPTNESKEIIKKYGELWSKITDLLRSITSNSDNYDEKYMKGKFKLDDGLPLNKMLEVQRVIIVFRVSFHESNKWYTLMSF